MGSGLESLSPLLDYMWPYCLCRHYCALRGIDMRDYGGCRGAKKFRRVRGESKGSIVELFDQRNKVMLEGEDAGVLGKSG